MDGHQGTHACMHAPGGSTFQGLRAAPLCHGGLLLTKKFVCVVQLLATLCVFKSAAIAMPLQIPTPFEGSLRQPALVYMWSSARNMLVTATQEPTVVSNSDLLHIGSSLVRTSARSSRVFHTSAVQCRLKRCCTPPEHLCPPCRRISAAETIQRCK